MTTRKREKHGVEPNREKLRQEHFLLCIQVYGMCVLHIKYTNMGKSDVRLYVIIVFHMLAHNVLDITHSVRYILTDISHLRVYKSMPMSALLINFCTRLQSQ